MKVLVRNIRMPVEAKKKDVFAEAVKRLSGIAPADAFVSPEICRKSVDARHRTVTVVYSVSLVTDAIMEKDALAAADCCELVEGDPFENLVFGKREASGRPVVVGFGPCGMFSALTLAEKGYRPIVIERGDCVTARAFKVGRFMSTGVLDTETNIQFGAGGAGTFSDGKLVTRINDKRVDYILRRFVEFGAPLEVTTDAKPHVGTDKLMRVVSEIDSRIRSLGGEIYYNTCLKDIKTVGGNAAAVVTDSGEIPCGQVILATGHSSRDTVRYLSSSGFEIAPKPFSVGVRIEHLCEDIDRSIYGKYAGHPALGHAEYALSYRKGEDCVYTFCMCPGGEVIAAASEEGGVVTNGMSRHARNGRNSNAAVVVNVSPDSPTEFQRSIERAAFEAGGGGYAAPVQTVGDFLSGKWGTEPSRVLPTYMKGNVRTARLDRLFPARVTEMLRTGLKVFNGRIAGFADRDALLTGAETRTSSPVRMMRNDAMKALGHDNIYPCGEGAGYAGGITSAAVDGLSAAISVMSEFAPYKN